MEIRRYDELILVHITILYDNKIYKIMFEMKNEIEHFLSD